MTPRRKRALTLVGMTLVADGAVFVTNPAAQIRLWSSERAPAWYRRVMRLFAKHVSLCRALAATELLTGTALLLRAGREA